MKTTPDQNKALVLEAIEPLFNKRDYVAAERFWSPNYIQHSAHVAPGRDDGALARRSGLERLQEAIGKGSSGQGLVTENQLISARSSEQLILAPGQHWDNILG